MAQDLQRATFKNFSKGLVTDRSPLNAEPNTMADTQNMVLNRDGSVQRRKRFDIEDSASFRTLASPGLNDEGPLNRGDLKVFLWENVNNDPEFNIVVVISNQIIEFYDASSDPLDAGFISSIDAIGGFDSGSLQYKDFPEHSSVSANGELIVSSTDSEFTYLFRYDTSSGDVVQDTDLTRKVSVRDIWGWEPKKGIRERYTANADEADPLEESEEIDYAQQAYERINRGWTPTQIKAYSDYQVTNGAPDVLWLPPLASSPQMFKDTDLLIDFGLEDSIFFGKSPSRGGSVVIDLFDRGIKSGGGYDSLTSSRKEEFDELLSIIDATKFTELSSDSDRFTDEANGGIADIGYFYGRFWYIFREDSSFTAQGGDAEQIRPRIESLVAFSKITSDNSERNQCYQEADPTSEFISDRLITDGGTISLREMENPIALKQFTGGILVFARNGIWYITSGSDGFNPTDFIVKKISKYGVISKECIVEAEGSLYFLGKDDIYRVQLGEGNFPTVQNISFGVIGNYYDTINKDSLKWVRSTYDGKEKKVIWQWNQNTVSESTEGVLADTQLIFDLVLKAYYINKVEAQNFDSKSYLGPLLYIPGVDRAGDGKTLYTVVDFTGSPIDELIYTFGEVKDSGFEDFSSQNGTESDAFFLLNHYAGDAQVQNQVPMLTTHSKLMETGLVQDSNGDYTILENPGSVKVQAFFDFTDGSTTWGTSEELQAYKLPRTYLTDSSNFNYGQTVITTNIRLKGRGRALQLKFSSEPEHDFHLYGVTMLTASNQTY